MSCVPSCVPFIIELSCVPFALPKEIKTVEQSIAQLDEQKRTLHAKLMESTHAEEALRLHNEVAALTGQLTLAEERWWQLQEEIEGAA